MRELGIEQYESLVRCLENDWNIRASWDGLRQFWSIELTEEGVRLRDSCTQCAEGMGEYADSLCDPLKERIGQLEQLCHDMYDAILHGKEECDYTERMDALGLIDSETH